MLYASGAYEGLETPAIGSRQSTVVPPLRRWGPSRGGGEAYGAPHVQSSVQSVYLQEGNCMPKTGKWTWLQNCKGWGLRTEVATPIDTVVFRTSITVQWAFCGPWLSGSLRAQRPELQPQLSRERCFWVTFALSQDRAHVQPKYGPRFFKL